MYPPMTTEYQPGIGADIWLLGLSFIEIASRAASGLCGSDQMRRVSQKQGRNASQEVDGGECLRRGKAG